MHYPLTYSGCGPYTLGYQPTSILGTLSLIAAKPSAAISPYEFQLAKHLRALTLSGISYYWSPNVDWAISTSPSLARERSFPPLRRVGVSTHSIEPGRILFLPHEVDGNSHFWSSSANSGKAGALGHPAVALSDVSTDGTVSCMVLTSWTSAGGSKGKWERNTDPIRKNYLPIDVPGGHLPEDIIFCERNYMPLLHCSTGGKTIDKHSYVDVNSTFQIEPCNLDIWKGGEVCITPGSMQLLFAYRDAKPSKPAV